MYPQRKHQNIDDPGTEALKKLRIFNLAISVFYLLEQIMKMWAYGIIFCQRLDFLFDSFVAASLIIIQTLLEIEINKVNQLLYCPCIFLISQM